MKIHTFNWLIAGALMTSLTGCGGGGSSSTPQTSAGKTVITGTASAGIIYPGTVKVYAVNAGGAKGALVGTAATSISGKYSAALGSYSGAVEVEVSGSYTDEATGRPVTISLSSPLHALVDKVNETTDNNRVVSVTPLTELAWRKASINGTVVTTPAAMVTANTLVKNLFKVSDIIGIEPVRFDNATMANASQESQAYTLALATLSKMASTSAGATDNDKLESSLTSMETEIENAEKSDVMSPTAIGEFATALGTVSLSKDFPSATAQLTGVGRKSQLLTMTAGGLPAGTKIYTIEGTIALPLNSVSLRAEGNGTTLADVFLLNGIASGIDTTFSLATYLAPQKLVHFRVVFSPSGTGIGSGDFATLAYDVASGATISAADFSLTVGSVAVKDANGADIAGATVTIK